MHRKWHVLDVAEAGRFSREWDAINESAGELPFMRWEFVARSLNAFGTGQERLAVAQADSEPHAMAVLTSKRFGVWETFQPSQLPLGAWVMRPGHDLADFVNGLLGSLPGFALQLGLTQLDPQVVPRPDDRGTISTMDYISTAWVPVAGTFESYWEARGKNLRTNMRKQRQKLESDRIITRLEELRRPQDVAGVIADYGRLESGGWKASGGTAIDPENTQGRFYRDLLESFCAAGAGRMYRYWFDDKVVAVDLCVEGGGALVILKTTYDESIKTLSPAFLMRQEAFKRLFEEGRIRRIEFFGKLMEWHTRWTSEVRTLYHVNSYRWRWLPKLREVLARPAESQSGRASNGAQM